MLKNVQKLGERFDIKWPVQCVYRHTCTPTQSIIVNAIIYNTLQYSSTAGHAANSKQLMCYCDFK